jgi:hypothetical protein
VQEPENLDHCNREYGERAVMSTKSEEQTGSSVAVPKAICMLPSNQTVITVVTSLRNVCVESISSACDDFIHY